MKIFQQMLWLLILSAGLVAVCFIFQEKPAKNGFNRGQIRTPALLNALNLEYNSYYIKGLSAERILLGNYTDSGLFSCGYDLKALQAVPPSPDKDQHSDAKTYTLPADFFKDRPDNFTVDGFTCYNKAAGRVIFTFYYRNQFICLDTNLKVLYTAGMIDTNTVAKIKVAEYEADGKTIRTMAKPALAVNKRAYSNGNFVFIESALAADNEDRAVFDKQVVLDVYLLNSGRYSHSLYLPKYKGQKLRFFAVQGDLLIALYERHMVTYRVE